MSYICVECGKEVNLGAWDIAMVQGLKVCHCSCFEHRQARGEEHK